MGDCGCARAPWRVVVVLLLSASHPLSSLFPPSSLLLAGPRRLCLGTQPGTVPPSSGAPCLRRRCPAVLRLPLGWRLRPRRVLERKAFPSRPAPGAAASPGGCWGSRRWVPLHSGAVPGGPGSVLSVEAAQLGWAGVWSRMERGREPRGGRTHGWCPRSRGTWRWQGSQQVGTVAPGAGALVAWPCGQCPSWFHVSPAPCWTCRSAAAAMAMAQGVPMGFGTAVLCPCSLPRPSAGQRLTLLAFTPRLSASPGSSGRCPSSPLWPRPCCSSGLTWGLLRGGGDIPAAPARHFPWRGLCRHCAVSCVPPFCPCSVSCVPAACPMSPQHAWCPCVLACGWRGCPLSGLWVRELSSSRLAVVAVVNVLLAHCDFLSPPNPLGSPGAAGMVGTCARKSWGLRRVAMTTQHVTLWPGSPAPFSPRDVAGGG